jgi:plasmid stability protein
MEKWEDHAWRETQAPDCDIDGGMPIREGLRLLEEREQASDAALEELRHPDPNHHSRTGGQELRVPIYGKEMCYMWYRMDTTVRNLDPNAYRALRARAVMEGRTIGEMISEAIRAYLARGEEKRGGGTLRALRPEPFPAGNEGLSLEIDGIVYGTKR